MFVESVFETSLSFRGVLRCLTARKLGREQKSERGGGGERRRRFPFSLSPPLPLPFLLSPHFARVQNYENRRGGGGGLAKNATETLATQAILS